MKLKLCLSEKNQTDRLLFKYVEASNVTKSIQLTFDFHMISWGSLLCSLASNTGAIVTGCCMLKCVFKLNLTDRNMQARIGFEILRFCGTTTSF